MSVTETTSRTRLQCRGDCSHFRNARDVAFMCGVLCARSQFFKSIKNKQNCPLSAKFLHAPRLLFNRQFIGSLCYLRAKSRFQWNTLRTIFKLVSVLLWVSTQIVLSLVLAPLWASAHCLVCKHRPFFFFFNQPCGWFSGDKYRSGLPQGNLPRIHLTSEVAWWNDTFNHSPPLRIFVACGVTEVVTGSKQAASWH